MKYRNTCMMDTIYHLDQTVNKIRFLERQIGSCENFMLHCDDKARETFETLALKYRQDLEDVLAGYRLYISNLEDKAFGELCEDEPESIDEFFGE